MKILFTGATGVLGRAAVPRLVEDGHDVIAVSRSPEDAAWLEGMGARPEAFDLFDPSAIDRAVDGVDTVVHFATAIPPMSKMTKRRSWEMNDRLRSRLCRHRRRRRQEPGQPPSNRQAGEGEGRRPCPDRCPSSGPGGRDPVPISREGEPG